MDEKEVFAGESKQSSRNVVTDAGKAVQSFQKNFGEVQIILDQNRVLINEINRNQESKMPHNLTRNVSLIRELNNNIRRVVDLYGDISTSLAKSSSAVQASSEGDSSGRPAGPPGPDSNNRAAAPGHKRVRP